MSDFFSSPLWTGVAGMMQIIAAIAALVTVWQAKTMIDKANDERRASEQSRSEERERTLPLWQLESKNAVYRTPAEYSIDISFVNVGLTTAHDLQVEYKVVSGPRPLTMNVSGAFGGATDLIGPAITPERNGYVHLEWGQCEPAEGVVRLNYLTVGGGVRAWSFVLRTHPDASRREVRCDVKAVIQTA